jgi:hypothetical protein
VTNRSAGRLLVLLCALCVAASASAGTSKVPQLIFPVVGGATYIDDFGAPRPGGPHQGNDLLAARHTPAVAVEGGKVEFWTTSASAGCMLYLHGDSGTTYLYIHLNNDLTAGNDNKGKCVAGTAYAPGLKNGTHVAAGQLVGFVGDSGDANGIHPHLHFELHPNGGSAVDPYPFLRRARQLLFYAKPGSPFSLALTGTVSSAQSGSLELNLSGLQLLPSGQKLVLARKLVVAIASDATVRMSDRLPGISSLLDLSWVKTGMSVTVYTEQAPATLAAQRGDADALTAATIVLG